jgi:hypothetical protein
MRSSACLTAVLIALLGGNSLSAQPPEAKPKPPAVVVDQIESRNITSWLQDLTDKDAGVREQAIRAIVYFTAPPTSEVIQGLVSRCKDDDYSVRVRAIMALTVLKVNKNEIPRVVSVMGERLTSDSQVLVRFHAVVCLVNYGADARDAVPALMKGAVDPGSFEIRRMSLRALQACGYLNVTVPQGQHPPPDPKVTQQLLASLRDKTNAVKLEAVLALGGMGRSPDPNLQKQVEDGLMAMMNSHDKSVAIWSIVSAMALDKPNDNYVARLIKYTKSTESHKTRIQAINALSTVGVRSKGTLPALIDLLEDRDPGVVVSACIGIAGLGEAGLPALKALQKVAASTTDKDLKIFVEDAIKYLNGGK